MLIRYGYEITLTCQQPTAVCQLSVHEDRAADIRVPETVFTTPDVPTSTYRDLFGNQCRRLFAPAGDLAIRADATIGTTPNPTGLSGVRGRWRCTNSLDGGLSGVPSAIIMGSGPTQVHPRAQHSALTQVQKSLADARRVGIRALNCRKPPAHRSGPCSRPPAAAWSCASATAPSALIPLQ
jgi:hypothetical protein